MKQVANTLPTANLAISKSRLKMYNKKSEMPVYYLQKGQEFQIELFNPTTDTIMAKISLNNTPIAQGGLVLRPGERVFLDRYIDVAKKFMFDTYTVANTKEVKAAIQENGDFKVEFYKERIYNHNQYFGGLQSSGGFIGDYHNTGVFGSTTTGNSNFNLRSNTIGNLDLKSTNICDTSGHATLDWLQDDTTFECATASVGTIIPPLELSEPVKKKKLKTIRSKKSKEIETGRIEMGSHSSQKLQTVHKEWEYSPFWTLQYKMLPMSQKVTTVNEVNTKKYCTNCGSKNKSNFKFCPSCGTKV